MKLRHCLYGLVVLAGAVALAGCSGMVVTPIQGPAPAVPTASQTLASPTAPATTQPATPTTLATPVKTLPPLAYPYPAGTPLPPEKPPASPIPMGSETAPVGVNPALLELAKTDLAQRLSVAANQITVVSSEYVDWPDSSLGCPEPGMAYSQVITPGYRFILQYGQKQYDYHTGLRSTLVLCTKLR